MRESVLQTQVADYLRLRYPTVVFHSDFGSGIKLTPGQAAKQKRQNGGQRSWPDMLIAEPKKILKRANNKIITVSASDGWCGDELGTMREEDFFYDYEFVAGLFLELKREGTRLKKKNGDWATPHLAEQAEMLEKLRSRGYKAEFTVGFDETKRIIDGYLVDVYQR